METGFVTTTHVINGVFVYTGSVSAASSSALQLPWKSLHKESTAVLKPQVSHFLHQRKALLYRLSISVLMSLLFVSYISFYY